MTIIEEIRAAENELMSLYGESKPFSEHLIKREDNILKDKYDHNYFEYSDDFTIAEYDAAYQYQKNRGDNFLKFVGRQALKDSFKMEGGIVLTMLLTNNDGSSWKTNNNLSFKKPSIKEEQEIELKHYGSVYGENFVIKNVERLGEKQEYLGAYLGDVLVGTCLPFVLERFVGIDEVLVDERYRKQYICTSLLKAVVDKYPDKMIYLHADDDDTPKELYQKLGFETVDKIYSYQTTVDVE